MMETKALDGREEGLWCMHGRGVSVMGAVYEGVVCEDLHVGCVVNSM